MRNQSSIVGPLGLSFLFAWMLFPASVDADNIEGTYQLYEAGSSKAIATMTISNQSGDRFSVNGAGWSGSGSISGGYYDWRFTDGKSGRTTFSISADGSINGHVQSADAGQELNWSYVARPISRPTSKSGVRPSGDPRPKDDEFVYWNFRNSGSTDSYVTVCVEYANGTTTRPGTPVPAHGNADVSLGHKSLKVVRVRWKEGHEDACQ
jgi:hypothetical protein